MCKKSFYKSMTYEQLACFKFRFLRRPLIGAFTAGAQFGIGEALGHATPSILGSQGGIAAAKAVAHAAVGCASAAAAGGSCRAGAMAAGFSSLAGPAISGAVGESFAANLAGRMIIGAMASKLGGGKYENGALTAAMEYLFNEMGAIAKAYRLSYKERMTQAAESMGGSDYFHVKNDLTAEYGVGSGGNKCNVFVHAMATGAGIEMPMISTRWGLGPIVPATTALWGDVGYANANWAVVPGGQSSRGDMIIMDGHMGIIGAESTTISHSSRTHKVVVNEFGFFSDPSQYRTVRTFVGSDLSRRFYE
jgi:hypothetical protein